MASLLVWVLWGGGGGGIALDAARPPRIETAKAFNYPRVFWVHNRLCDFVPQFGGNEDHVRLCWWIGGSRQSFRQVRHLHRLHRDRYLALPFDSVAWSPDVRHFPRLSPPPASSLRHPGAPTHLTLSSPFPL